MKIGSLETMWAEDEMHNCSFYCMTGEVLKHFKFFFSTHQSSFFLANYKEKT